MKFDKLVDNDLIKHVLTSENFEFDNEQRILDFLDIIYKNNYIIQYNILK